jgi:hypothetical protein
LVRLRKSTSRRPADRPTINEAVDLVGGRLSYLNKVHKLFHLRRKINAVIGGESKRYDKHGEAYVEGGEGMATKSNR